MTGTGAAVFLPLQTESEGYEILSQLPPHWQGIVTQGKNRSPLLARIGQCAIGSRQETVASESICK
jgi:hypothetical protein